MNRNISLINYKKALALQIKYHFVIIIGADAHDKQMQRIQDENGAIQLVI